MNSNNLPWVLLAALLLFLLAWSARADGYEFKSYLMSETVTVVTTNQPCTWAEVREGLPLFAYQRVSAPGKPAELMAGCYTERGIETVIKWESGDVVVIPSKNFQLGVGV